MKKFGSAPKAPPGVEFPAVGCSSSLWQTAWDLVEEAPHCHSSSGLQTAGHWFISSQFSSVSLFTYLLATSICVYEPVSVCICVYNIASTHTYTHTHLCKVLTTLKLVSNLASSSPAGRGDLPWHVWRRVQEHDGKQPHHPSKTPLVWPTSLLSCLVMYDFHVRLLWNAMFFIHPFGSGTVRSLHTQGLQFYWFVLYKMYVRLYALHVVCVCVCVCVCDSM